MTRELDAADLRQQVRRAYGSIAADPSGTHPIPVGRRLAEAAGYPAGWLADAPADALDAFAGVSCLPCFARVAAGEVVLDLGCGAGLDSLLIAPGAGRVLGVDFAAEMVARARRAAEEAGAANVEFRQGDAEAIPAETASIDVAIVNGIFNLNPARGAIFEELGRVVRPGGRVFAAELVLVGPGPGLATDWFA